MAEASAEAGVEAVLGSYVEACRRGDVDLLREIFHPQAAMNGYLAGTLLVGGPGPFFEAISANAAPAESGAPYSAEIDNIRIDGHMAAEADGQVSGFDDGCCIFVVHS